MKLKSFPLYTQPDSMDYGPTCLRMIAKHYGRSYTLQTLREQSFITREEVSIPGISDAAESIGMHTQGVRYCIADPAEQKYVMNHEEFCRHWYSSSHLCAHSWHPNRSTQI